MANVKGACAGARLNDACQVPEPCAGFRCYRVQPVSMMRSVAICHAAPARTTLQHAQSGYFARVAALGNRPGFQSALATLKSGDTLLTADLTRLSRSQELAPLLDRLRFRGIRVVGVLDGFDCDSPGELVPHEVQVIR